MPQPGLYPESAICMEGHMTENIPTPKRPTSELTGSIVYAIWLQPFGKLPASLQKELIATHGLAKKKAPVIYVGQTRLEAEDRYANHLAGYKGSRTVKKHHRQLIVLDKWKPAFPFAISPDLVKAIYFLARRSKGNPTDREAAVATLLRQAGFYVHSA
jgi:hypothetical protein